MADHDTIEPAVAPAADARADTAENPDAQPSDPLTLLQREKDDVYDRLLRKTAEFDNYRKRIERERRDHADRAVADLLLELLLVVDDFDRAVTVDAADESGANRKGVELIHTKLHDLLRKQGVRAIETLGADFDPNVHQAVVHEEKPGSREGEVIDELRRGYMLGDRLLRPAMVKVAKA